MDINKSLDVETKDIENIDDAIFQINTGLNSIVLNFYRVGKLLSEVKQKGLFALKGYDTFVDFTYHQFNLSKSQSYKLVNIYNKFPIDDYKDFTFSQLSEMLSIPDSKVSEISSDMTIKEIREVKKKEKEKDIQFGDQIDVVDVLSLDHEESDIKKEDFIPVSKRPLKEQVEYWFNELNEQSKKFSLECQKLNNSNIEKDEQINSLKNENSNLIFQLADVQKIQRENEKLKKENEKLKKTNDRFKNANLKLIESVEKNSKDNS